MGLHITRAGLVVPVRIDPSGRTGPTAGHARGPRWRSAGPSHYVPSDVPVTTQQRIVEAVACLPPGSAATGWAALDIVVVDGLPITVPLRSVPFAARTSADDLAAVRAIDMAAYDDLVDLAALHAYTTRLVGRRGKRRLERALAAADENAWSPMEVVMRRIWHQHRGGRLLCNAPIFDLQGRHLFTPDLLDPVAGVAGDDDGADHLEGGRHSRDLMREELTRRAGIEVVTMMAGQGEAARFRYRLDGALARADQRSAPRSWTLIQPDWWVDTSTVARRRALAPAQREVWLRHRRT
ncbi:hypothetical protein ACFFOS_09505 [Nocardioides kongjuensis]|uniref:Uncharacterized protein n=1 Tax=Nocardioides kongjuensis TaxID=349522 RepID=A0A852RMP4_9ACTN|nr:hypothetical protein [Nocardioides kongjuensis]NYD30556.1 hypothetical protein [Nocardioides kongjuensis]